MKRIAVLVLVGLLAVATGGFALKNTADFAVGAELTSVNFSTLGAMATLHFSKLPLFLGIGANFLGPLSGGFELTTTVDYWLVHNPIGAGYFSYIIGIGVSAVFGLDPFWVAAGIRVPIGLQIWPLNNEKLELFAEIAPAWVPLYAGGFDPLKFQAQVALGCRFWFEGSK